MSKPDSSAEIFSSVFLEELEITTTDVSYVGGDCLPDGTIKLSMYIKERCGRKAACPCKEVEELPALEIKKHAHRSAAPTVSTDEQRL